MKLKEIKHQLETDIELREQLKDKYFIGAITYLEGENETIKRWELNYYDPKTSKVLRYVVDDEGYDVYEGELLSSLENIPIEREIAIDEEEALNLAHERYMNDYKNQEVMGVLIALDMIKGKWLVSLITRNLTAIQYSIDLFTKEISKKEVRLNATA